MRSTGNLFYFTVPAFQVIIHARPINIVDVSVTQAELYIQPCALKVSNKLICVGNIRLVCQPKLI